MGDILKRHLSIVIAAVITIVGTVALGLLSIKAWKDVGKKEKVLTKIKGDKQKIFDFRWALNQKNRETAQKNLDLAVSKYQGKYDEIAGKYKPAREEDLKPIACVDRLRTDCETMRDRLSTNGVVFNESTGKFTFSQYLDSAELPKEEVIPKVMKHLQIIDELVDLVGKSGVTDLTGLERDEEKLEMEKGNGYRYYNYQLRVSGSFDAVRTLVNSMNTANYFFIVREMTVIPEDIVGSMNTGNGAASKGGGGTKKMPNDDFMDEPGGGTKKAPTPKASGGAAQFKENRLAFTKMSSVQLTISLDYVEIQEDAKSKRKRPKGSAKKTL